MMTEISKDKDDKYHVSSITFTGDKKNENNTSKTQK